MRALPTSSIRSPRCPEPSPRSNTCVTCPASPPGTCSSWGCSKNSCEIVGFCWICGKIFGDLISFLHFFECLFKEDQSLNFFWHLLHVKLRRPVWMVRCSDKFEVWENVLPQSSHLKKTTFSIYILSNKCRWCLYLYGFSPVWTLMCRVNSLSDRNFLLQKEHGIFFSWLCSFTCSLRYWDRANTFSQIVHLKGSPWNNSKNIYKFIKRLNRGFVWGLPVHESFLCETFYTFHSWTFSRRYHR